METDWKKKYEEALEKARELYGTVAVGKNFFVEIFPELRESEDAMMEKAIVDALLSHCNSINLLSARGYQIEDVKAWLEKQKEQKPLETPSPSVIYTEQGDVLAEQKPIGTDFRTAIKNLMNLHKIKNEFTEEDYDFHAKELFELVEQKPSELSEEDIKKIRSEEYTKGFNDAAFGGKLKEWSEEDEKMLNRIIETLSLPPIYDTKACAKMVSWLKSLRPQPHKEIYQAAKHDLAIKFMNYLDENRPEGKMSLSNGECEDIYKAFEENDWAKIMRYAEKYSPHWKPSEEQMNSLRDTIVYTKGYSYSMYLPELYEQLNKLM